MTKYLFRIDDVYEFMNLENFNNIISIFEENNISVMLGVTPDWKLVSYEGFDFIFSNKLTKSSFFSLINDLQKKGNIIALHGHQHTILTKDSGLLGINPFGEFSSLSYKLQKEKIKTSLNILSKFHIKTNVFMAPAHSFDKNTIKVLKEFNFKYISDGLFLYPQNKSGLIFLPQIFGQVRNFPLGVITIALHPNYMTNKDFSKLKKFIKENRKNILDYNNFLISLEKNKNLNKSFNKLINILSNIVIKTYFKFRK